MKKKLFPLLLALVCAVACMFSLVACDGGKNTNKQTVAVTGVTLNKTELTLEIDGSEMLTATVSPDNATEKTVTWSSNKPDIATVSNGKVTAVSEGTATVTATAGGKSATCTVTVKAAKPGIVLTEDTDFSALVGEKVTEAEWKAAFATTAYMNVTVKTLSNNDNSVWKKSGEIISEYIDDVMMSVTDVKPDKVISVIPGEAFDREGYVGIECEDSLYNFLSTYKVACPDFSAWFSAFEYDETLKAYAFDHKTVTTNSIYENWDRDYNFAVVKIINGKLAFVKAGNYDYDGTILNISNIYFYDFGVTEITIPEYTLLDPSEYME